MLGITGLAQLFAQLTSRLHWYKRIRVARPTASRQVNAYQYDYEPHLCTFALHLSCLPPSRVPELHSYQINVEIIQNFHPFTMAFFVSPVEYTEQ